MATVHPHRSFAKKASALTGMRHLNITANDPKYKRGEREKRPHKATKPGSRIAVQNKSVKICRGASPLSRDQLWKIDFDTV